MNKLLFSAALLGVAMLPLVRLQLVARAADPPAGLVAVKDKMAQLDSKLEQVKEGLEALKSRGEEIKASVESKVSELKKLAEDPAQLSDRFRAAVKAFKEADEPTQLATVKEIHLIKKEEQQLMALAHAIHESGHESVRQLAMQMVIAKGEAGYPTLGLFYETLSQKDRAFFAKELNKQTSNDKLLLFGLMAKDADAELFNTLLSLELTADQRLMFLGSQADAKKDDEQFVAKVLDLGDKGKGDEGLLILYAIAKSSSAKNATEAVKLAVKRKADAWPVIAAAYKKEDRDCRTAVVRAAKELGGEGGDFLIKTALAEENADLRAAAEEAVK